MGTGERVYATFVVIQAGCIIRVPRSAVKSIIEADGALGELLVQTIFRRRQALLLLRSRPAAHRVALLPGYPAPGGVRRPQPLGLFVDAGGADRGRLRREGVDGQPAMVKFSRTTLEMGCSLPVISAGAVPLTA